MVFCLIRKKVVFLHGFFKTLNMHKNLLKLVLVLSLIHTTTFAQQFGWVKTMPNQTYVNPFFGTTVSDDQGAIYMSGHPSASQSQNFNGATLDLDLGAGTSSISLDQGATYIAKYDSSGNFIWGNNYKDVAENSTIAVNYLRVNPINKDVYVFGFFSDTCNFDLNNPANPAARLIGLPSGYNSEAFVAIYSTNGVFKSVHRFENYSGYVHSDGQAYNGDFVITGAEFDKNGRLIVYGNAVGYVNYDLYGGAGVYGAGFESLAIYYDENLNISNLLTAGENYEYTIMDLAPDQFNSWYLLLKSNHAQLDYEMGIVKTDTAGFVKWGKYTPMSYAANIIIATEYTTPEMIKVDSKGNLYVTGRFKGTLDLNLAPNASNVITNSNLPTGFIARYDSSGTYKWGYKTSTTNPNQGQGGLFGSIAINDNDQLAIAFSAYEGCYINFKQNTIDSSGSFLMIVDSMANLVSYNAFKTLNGGSQPSVGSLSTYKNKIRFIGKIDDTTIFQEGVANSIVTGPNSQTWGSWAYLAEFNSCNWSVTNVTASICSGESYTINGQSFTQSGNYTISIPQSSGCDSVVSLNLNVLPVIDTTVVANTNTLQAVANNPAYIYQWIDCSTNQEVAGANSRTFTASAQGGTYRVKITNGNCVFESGCHTVTPTSLKDVALSNIAAVFPNPVNDKLGLVFNNTMYVNNISITNLAGVSVWNEVVDASIKAKELDVAQLASGTYIITITVGNKQYIQKFAKY